MPDDFKGYEPDDLTWVRMAQLRQGCPHGTVGYSDGVRPETPAPLQNADIDAVFAARQLRQYDEKGDLRGPSR
jgi:hypothetical protein